jgi:hypothetical protein
LGVGEKRLKKIKLVTTRSQAGALMTLTAIAILTVFAALLTGFAVTGTLRLLWQTDGETRQPAYAAIHGLHTDPGKLSGIMRAQSWVDLTTMDTPMLRRIAPARTPVPVMSWGDSNMSADAEADALLRELCES